MSEEKKEQPGGSHILRIGAGCYLVYLAWSLISEIFAGTATSLWLGVGAAVLFAAVGAALVITSGRALYRQKRDEQQEND